MKSCYRSLAQLDSQRELYGGLFKSYLSKRIFQLRLHRVKSVRIWSYFGHEFPAFKPK